MTDDERDPQRSDDRPVPEPGESLVFLELAYPDELAYDANPMLEIENPLMEMRQFEYDGFRD